MKRRIYHREIPLRDWGRHRRQFSPEFRHRIGSGRRRFDGADKHGSRLLQLDIFHEGQSGMDENVVQNRVINSISQTNGMGEVWRGGRMRRCKIGRSSSKCPARPGNDWQSCPGRARSTLRSLSWGCASSVAKMSGRKTKILIPTDSIRKNDIIQTKFITGNISHAKAEPTTFNNFLIKKLSFWKKNKGINWRRSWNDNFSFDVLVLQNQRR